MTVCHITQLKVKATRPSYLEIHFFQSSSIIYSVNNSTIFTFVRAGLFKNFWSFVSHDLDEKNFAVLRADYRQFQMWVLLLLIHCV